MESLRKKSGMHQLTLAKNNDGSSTYCRNMVDFSLNKALNHVPFCGFVSRMKGRNLQGPKGWQFMHLMWLTWCYSWQKCMHQLRVDHWQ